MKFGGMTPLMARAAFLSRRAAGGDCAGREDRASLRAAPRRRDQRRRPAAGRRRPGRPVRRTAPRLRQPWPLPDRPAAPPTTRRSTTRPPGTAMFPARPSPATRPDPAGTRSLAGKPSTQAPGPPACPLRQLVTPAGGTDPARRDRRLREGSDVHGIGPGPAERRKQPHPQNPDHLPHQANPRAPPRPPVNTLTVTSA